MPVALWDRRKDESEVEYARFLSYLRIGPLRTLAKAYTRYTSELPNASPGGKRRKAPGSWDRDSSRFEWRRRASAWDVRNLKKHGTRAAVLYLRSLEKVSEKVYRALPTAELGGEEWPDIISTMNLLAKQLSPDALRGEDEDAVGDGDTGQLAAPEAAPVE